MLINFLLFLKYKNKARNIKPLFLALFCCISTGVVSQSHQISISLEGTHINTNSEAWFNALGLKFGYKYQFIDRFSAIAELGTTSLYGKDTKNGDLAILLTEAKKRKAFDYRIFRLGGLLRLIDFQEHSFSMHMGVSLRHANEIIHTSDPKVHLLGKKNKNTSDIILTTTYNTRWDNGMFLGISYRLRIRPFLDMHLFTEVDSYGKEHSFFTSGIKTFFKIQRQ